ncbi:putative transcriptional activator protein [Tuber indicum]|nr:putative transcriptional activator protein [Tuber indicum]
MPGILPMKLIKCGSSQTRIAQACDRCRSKKIRCDGIRPCCSQCANVGFECKTSDKLSRRAFPRGYTESLEERVRCLEQEVREMKDLLDAKDEQLDMLSRIHSFSPYSPPASAISGGSHRAHKSPESARSGSADLGLDDTFVIHETSSLVGGSEADGNGAFYVGSSSGRQFLELFKKKSGADFNPDILFGGSQSVKRSEQTNSHEDTIKTPPRLLSDRLLVSYFQEHHPLFPVLHRPTFLASYKKLVSGGGSQSNTLPHHAVAQLFLVFAIAQQNEVRPRTDGPDQQFDAQWQRSLNAIIGDSTVETLQCLVLAQLYCFSLGDYSRLLHYKSLAVGTTLRLGLNQSQRKFNLGALSGEMRKRTFWCVYCLDSFSAAMLGLPKLFKDEDIDTEYPSDIDDEYVSEKGFSPTLPGDSTKISSALALFRSSRVLSKVLDAVYPTSSSHEVSYTKLRELEDELGAWKSGLAPHLRLEFVNGTPATNVVDSRSPLLVLAYHYIRSLIHRPIIGSTLDSKVSASLHMIRESNKCIIQIIQLLTERKLGFSFCLNKTQLLLMSGFTLLHSTLDCPQHTPLAKENQRLITGVLEEIESCRPLVAKELRPIAAAVVNIEPRVAASSRNQHEKPKEHTQSPLTPPLVSPTEQGPLRRRFSSISAEFSLRRGKSGDIRRASSQDMSGMGDHGGVRLTSASLTDLSPTPRTRYPAASHAATVKISQGRQILISDSPYLDGPWDMGSNDLHPNSQNPPPISPYDWERLLAAMDQTHATHIYGGEDRGSGTFIHPSDSLSAEIGTRPVDQHWSLSETPTTASFRGTPPSISSFSTLSEESFTGGDDVRADTGDLDVDSGYPDSDNLGDFLGPLMGTRSDGSGGVLLENSWHM